MQTGSISNFLANKKLTYATKGIMGAVVGTTILKAIGRPAFNLMDKKSDKDARKYSATNEFLYQLLCLGMTFAMVIPAQHIVFKYGKNYIKGVKGLQNIKSFKDFEIVGKDINELTKEAQTLLNTKKTCLSKKEKKHFNLLKGAIELTSFVTSIVGLTIVSPLLSHKILHPVMKALGMNKKESPNPALERLEQPILSEGHHKKVDAHA